MSEEIRKRRKSLVDVVCPDCGLVRERERRDIHRYSHYCRSCIQKRKPVATYLTGRNAHNEESKKMYLQNPFDSQNIKILPRSKMSRIYKQAIARGISWSLNAQFLDSLFVAQKGRCALSGITLILDYGKNSLSIDRIDSSKGYHPGNVQFVVKEVNLMKHEMTQEDFKEMCNLIVNYKIDPGAELVIDRPLEANPYYDIQEKLTFNGLSLTIPEWELKMDFRPGTIDLRLNKGWTIEQALSEPLGQADGKLNKIRNKKRQKLIHFNGQTMNMSQWEHRLGFRPHTLKQRLAKGWSIERALTEPVVQGKNQAHPDSINARQQGKSNKIKRKVRPPVKE